MIYRLTLLAMVCVRDAAIVVMSSECRHCWVICKYFWDGTWKEVRIWPGGVGSHVDEVEARVDWEEVEDDVDWGEIELTDMSWKEVENDVTWEVGEGFLESAFFLMFAEGAGGTEYIWFSLSTSPCWWRTDNLVVQRTTPVLVL